MNIGKIVAIHENVVDNHVQQVPITDGDMRTGEAGERVRTALPQGLVMVDVERVGHQDEQHVVPLAG